MMKKTILAIPFCLLMILGAFSSAFSEYAVSQITNNATEDINPRISRNGDMVWIGKGLYSQEIFVRDGITKNITQLTNNFVFEESPQINDNGDVVWVQWNEAESDTNIMLYTKETVTNKITRLDPFDNPAIMDSDSLPQLNNRRQVVWRSFDGNYNQIMFSDGETPVFRVTNNNLNNNTPQLNNNGDFVWTAGSPFTGITDIWQYDSVNGARPITASPSVPEFSPQINDSGNIVWYGWSGATMSSGNYEIYYYTRTGATITRLTNNTYPDMSPSLNAYDQIVWMADISTTTTDLYFRDGLNGTNKNITNNSNDNGNFTLNDNGWVAWAMGMGSIDNNDNQIWVYDGTTTLRQLTSNLAYDNIDPQINHDNDLIWSGTGGGGTTVTDYEIFMATTSTLCMPPANGVCVDNNACTTDGYNAAAPGPGTCPCVYTPVANGTACNDGLFCTINDSCTNGTCGGAFNPCSDTVSCTIDTCNETTDACVHTPNNILCPSDGLFCNGMESCNATVGCVSSGTPCTVAPNTVCDEAADTCKSPVTSCTPPANGVCVDNNACTTDGYKATAAGPGTCPCVYTPVANGTACDDGLFCTINDSCSNGICGGALNPCSDNITCTIDICLETIRACAHIPDGGACPGDGLFCTGTEICSATLGCVPSGNPCTVAPNTVCDEAADTCKPPVVSCTPPSNGVCVDNNACTTDGYNAAAPGPGTCPCVYTPVANGTSCNDGLFCTINDTCANGTCGGSANSCSDNINCTIDICLETISSCAHIPDGGACPGDGLFCTGTEICSATLGCVPSGNPCTVAPNTVCDEVADTCKPPVVSCTPPVNGVCIDNNACTTDSYNAAAPGPGTCPCVYAPVLNGTACNDNNPCTTGDVCLNKACQPGLQKNCSDGLTCTNDICDTTTGVCSNPVNCVSPQVCNASGICQTAPSNCTKSATILGGGQSGSIDQQIQIKISVTNGGCISAFSVNTVTVTQGSNLSMDFSVGAGPLPSNGTLDGAPIKVDVPLTLNNAAGSCKITLTNKENGGIDIDKITISTN